MADKRISQLVDRGTVANNDVVPIVVSGATTTNKATISSIQTFMQGNLDLGVTSVGITLGSSGTDVSVSGSPITSSGNITINLPTASATNRGLLSAADWTTFNSKQQAITLTTTGTSGAATLVSGALNIPNYSTDLSGYVTLGTTQTITAQKTFTTSGSSDTMIISHGSGSGFALDVLKAGNGEAIRVTKSSGSGNAMTISGGNFEAPTIVKTGGTSSQFLKADGTIDSSTYLTTASAGTTYVPYTGAGANVDLGIYNLTANAVNVNASGSNAGVINLESNTIFSLVNGYGTIGSGTTNQFNFYQTTGAGVFRGAILSLNSITASATRTYTLPDADGTLALTSSLGAYLPLTGGTLSNNLFITGGGLQVSGSASANRQVVELYTSGSVSRLAASYVGSSSYGDLELLTGGLARLTISAAGATTLTGALNGTSASFTDDVSLSGAKNVRWGLDDGSASARSWGIRNGYNASGDFVVLSSSTNNTTLNTVQLQIARTGAATFSSSVTAGDIFSTDGTRINFFGVGTGANVGYVGMTTNHSLAFLANNSEKMRITSSGNVGIGTASPGLPLDVVINNSTAYLTTSRANTLRAYNISSSANVFAGIELAADGPGNAGIVGINGVVTGSGSGAMTFYTRDSSTFGERMRITSGGNVGIGTTTINSERLTVVQTTGNASALYVYTSGVTTGQSYGLTIEGGTNASDRSFAVFNQGGTSEYLKVRGDGLIQTGTASASPYNNTSGAAANMVVTSGGTLERSTSSLKYKTDIVNYDKGLAEVLRMRPVYYKSINEREKDLTFAGLIAEEIEELGLTEFVQYAEDGTPDALSYSNMVSLLIKSIQELKTEIDSLKNQMK